MKRGRHDVTSRAEGIQIEERSMTLEICIAINNEGGRERLGGACDGNRVSPSQSLTKSTWYYYCRVRYAFVNARVGWDITSFGKKAALFTRGLRSLFSHFVKGPFVNALSFVVFHEYWRIKGVKGI